MNPNQINLMQNEDGEENTITETKIESVKNTCKNITPNAKICSCCHLNLDIKNFRFRKDTHSHKTICNKCVLLKHKMWRDKNKDKIVEYYKKDWEKYGSKRKEKHLEYRLKTKKESKEYGKIYRDKNKKLIQIKSRIYAQKNKDHIIKYQAEYHQKNKEKIRQYRKFRVKTNIQTNIKSKLRSRIYTSLMRSRCGARKANKTFKLLGCSPEFFTSYIINKFSVGMTVNDLLSGKIHLDHIIPCAAFDLTKPEEQFKCFHYSNYQPLWAIDNLRKNAKIL